MSAITLLLGLLVVAYFASMLMGGRSLRGYGLPSGSEWLVLGFVIGPSVLGVASKDALSVFAPIVGVAMAWLSLVLGAEYGFAGERRVHLGGFVTGVLGALAVTALVSGSVYNACVHLAGMPQMDALCVSAGIGLASCETARYAVRWAAARSGAQGPIHDLLEDMADSDEIVPLIGIGVLFAFAPVGPADTMIGPWQWLAVTALLGILLGLTCAMLLRGMSAASDAWGVLLGAALLGTGIAWRLGLSPLTVMFLMGVSLSYSSRHGAELRRMLARSEPTVLLPTLLLAGALVSFKLPGMLLVVIGLAVAARGVARFALGLCIGSAARVDEAVRMPLAFGLFSTGALTMLVALTFALAFPGQLGDLVLATAFAMCVVGELIGPLSLSRALSHWKETDGPGASDGSNGSNGSNQPAPPSAPTQATS